MRRRGTTRRRFSFRLFSVFFLFAFAPTHLGGVTNVNRWLIAPMDSEVAAQPDSHRTPQMRRTLLLSGLYVFALTLLALPYAVVA